MIETKLVSYLNVRVKEINAQLKNNMKNKVNMLVWGDARRYARVITGRMRDNIMETVESNDKEVTGIIGYSKRLWPGNWVEYASYVELGTYKNDPRPFLFPALESNKNKIVTLLKGK